MLPQFLHFEFESFDGNSVGAHSGEITPPGSEIRLHIPKERQRADLVPNLAPPKVTQEHLTGREIAAMGALRLS